MGTQTLIFLLLEVMKGVHVKQHFHVYFDFLLNKKCKQEEFQFFFFFSGEITEINQVCATLLNS